MAEYKNQKSNPDPIIAKYKAADSKNAETVLKPLPNNFDENASVNKKIENNNSDVTEEPVNVKDLLSVKVNAIE